MTIENSIKLKLSSYTVDFEKGLINALNIIYRDIKCFGYYFHYTRALKKKKQKLWLASKIKYKIIKPLLKNLYRLPFIFYKDNNIINTICEKYITKNKEFTDFVNYFKKEWFQYYEIGMLDYSNIKKDYRFNSYIENYNRRIKLKLSKYLLGKNKYKITWPLFIYFIKEEENDIKNEIINYEKQIHKKKLNNKNIRK